MTLMPSLEDIAYGAGLANVDPASLSGALRSAGLAALRQPDRLGRSLVDLALTEGRVGMNTLGRLAGGKPEPVSTPPAGDRRFADRAWKENALLAGLVDAYLSCAFWAQDLVDGSDLDEDTRRKARFALGMMIDALAPSNTPWLNPEVSREAIDTKGLSLLRGARNFVHDVRHNGGRPSQVDTERFTVGVNLAATPGRVVLRNQLIELIAYEPQTPKVHAEPILCCPPWINKYYIMDLAPGRSFVEYAVQHGFTVFMISYRDPDESLSELTMDDYLQLGILSALDRVEKLTGAPRVNLVALCLGGTLALIALAYLAARGESKRVGWATLTNTLADFTEAGDLRVFTDEKSVAHLERTMRKKGYLEASRMAGTFDWLRGNDLVWNYVVSNWYMGKKPPAFDILAWNGDGTRMPAVMHSQYLRACYLDNLLVKPGAFSIAGETVDLGAIKNPLYVLSAEADHIAPWRAAYRHDAAGRRGGSLHLDFQRPYRGHREPARQSQSISLGARGLPARSGGLEERSYPRRGKLVGGLATLGKAPIGGADLTADAAPRRAGTWPPCPRADRPCGAGTWARWHPETKAQARPAPECELDPQPALDGVDRH